VTRLPSLSAGVLSELAEAACSQRFDHSSIEVAQLGEAVLMLTDELAFAREELRIARADRSALMLSAAFASAHHCAERLDAELHDDHAGFVGGRS